MLAAGNPTGSESNDAGFALEQQNIFQLVQLLQCSLDLVLHQAEVAHAEKSQARPPSPLAQRLQGAPAPGTGSAVRQLADCIEDSISQERRRGLELSLALREVRASVIRLQQANQCRAGAAIPSSPPAVAEPCPSSDVRSEPSEEVNCVGLEEAVVRRQAEAQLRFQIEEIKKKAFQEAQARKWALCC
ncbi:hypothetical protein N2152v2_001826 [Parachlorella kessleri]